VASQTEAGSTQAATGVTSMVHGLDGVKRSSMTLVSRSFESLPPVHFKRYCCFEGERSPSGSVFSCGLKLTCLDVTPLEVVLEGVFVPESGPALLA
jgi:hypothetical protein